MSFSRDCIRYNITIWTDIGELYLCYVSEINNIQSNSIQFNIKPCRHITFEPEAFIKCIHAANMNKMRII